MFQQMKNIDTAFRYVRMISFIVILASVAVSAYSLYLSYRMVSLAGQKIFILANGKALEAYAADRKDNIPVEARDHVRMFHHYFFTLDPDEKVIQSNITKALYLADGSAKEQYDALKENGYYSSLISGNISQQVEVDSIEVSMENYPYYFHCRAMQRIIRPSSIVTRSLVTEGYLRSVSRSDNN
ncbi:MAG: conjugative transposon protein TraK, partial [Williamsia sp.]|nr:conjugative transposon protein TraK [Williamsia sp.]